VRLKVGDRVRVRGQAEILATLDERGCLDSLPFMPQMLEACGREFRVTKRAHKLCDTVHSTGGRRMTNAVFLDQMRCDGRQYGGCEMECLIMWKDAWLERIDDAAPSPSASNPPSPELHRRVLAHVRPADRQMAGGAPVFSCQATEMPSATTHLSVWDMRQYVEDFVSGNASLRQIASVLFFLVYDTVASSGIGLGSFMRWSYEAFQRLGSGTTYPNRPGKLARNAKTPTSSLGVQPGEVVTVKAHSDVLGTVTEDLVNRGLAFHPEMVPFCSKTFVVEKRLRRIVNEKTGQILELKNPCLTLEGVGCAGHYTKPLLCPRGMAPYWREIWLEKAK
jgi:hypothetical protein